MSNHEQSLKTAYAEWYALPETDRVPNNSKEWSAEFGVPERTLTSWRKATWFRDMLDTLYGQVNVSPDRIQDVVDAMHRQAAAGNTKAAELYLRYVDRLKPPTVIIENKRVEEMTDAELEAELLAAVEKVRNGA